MTLQEIIEQLQVLSEKRRTFAVGAMQDRLQELANALQKLADGLLF